MREPKNRDYFIVEESEERFVVSELVVICTCWTKQQAQRTVESLRELDKRRAELGLEHLGG